MVALFVYSQSLLGVKHRLWVPPPTRTEDICPPRWTEDVCSRWRGRETFLCLMTAMFILEEEARAGGHGCRLPRRVEPPSCWWSTPGSSRGRPATVKRCTAPEWRSSSRRGFSSVSVLAVWPWRICPEETATVSDTPSRPCTAVPLSPSRSSSPFRCLCTVCWRSCKDGCSSSQPRPTAPRTRPFCY